MAGEKSFDAPFFVGFSITIAFIIYFIDTDTIFWFLDNEEEPADMTYSEMVLTNVVVCLCSDPRLMLSATQLQKDSKKRRDSNRKKERGSL